MTPSGVDGRFITVEIALKRKERIGLPGPLFPVEIRLLSGTVAMI
jgi:hypothetical protein